MKKTPLPPLTANLAAAILGIWKLKSREDVDATEQIHIDPLLGPEPLGILCFGPGHFAAQFMKRDRSPQPNASSPVQVKNNTVAVNGYDGYFGTYTVDESAGTLTTYLEGSISPDNVGKTYVRNVRVIDDELFIQLQTTTTTARLSREQIRSSAWGRSSRRPNQTIQPTAGRCTFSPPFMKTRPLQATLAFASGG